jgi:hypothetical protein
MVSLFEMAVLLLCIAVSGLHVLQPALGYLLALCPCNPVASATTGAVTLLALTAAYFTGVITVYLQIAPAPPALVPSPVALARLLFAALACALLGLLFLAIMPCL